MSRVVVLGGGYIGAALAQYLARRTHEVFVVGSSSVIPRLVAALPWPQMIREWLPDPGRWLRPFLEEVQPEVVVHAVGAARGRAVRDLSRAIEAQVEIMSYLSNWRTGLVIYLSSMAVYGIPFHVPVDESAPLQPEDNYGVLKCAAERLLLSGGETTVLRTTILRLAHVYGPSPVSPDSGGVVEIFRRAAAEGTRLIVDSDGLQERDFLHMRDLCEAVHRVVTLGVPGIFNIGGGVGVRIRELAALFSDKRAAAQSFRKRHGGGPSQLPSCWMNIEKARQQLGWVPQVSLQAGIEELQRGAYEN